MGVARYIEKGENEMEFTSNELSLIMAALATSWESLENAKTILHFNKAIKEEMYEDIEDSQNKSRKLIDKIKKEQHGKNSTDAIDDNRLIEELMHRASSDLKSSDAGISSNIECTEMRFRDKKTFDVMSKMFKELFYSTKIRTGKYDEDDEVEEPGAYYIRFD